MLPQAHPSAIHEVGRADAIIYGMGSLYTSICPTICLEGMGEAVAARNVHKVRVCAFMFVLYVYVCVYAGWH